jgi:hypothetical protein
MMEHILQFAVNIDDERIVRMVEEKAIKKALEDVDEAVKAKTDRKYRWDNYSFLEERIRDGVNKLIESRKDEIIDRAVVILAEKMARSKAVREAVGKVVEEVMEK